MSDSESDALPLGDTPTKSCSLYTKALKVKIFSKNKIRPKSTKRTDFFDVFLILIYSFAIMKNSKCHQIFIISEFFASFVIDFIITIPINRVIVGIISQNDVMSFFRVGRVFKIYLYQIIARIYLIFTISWNRTMIFNACLGEKTWNFPKSSRHEKRIRFARAAGIIFSFKFKIYAERKFFTIFPDCAPEST